MYQRKHDIANIYYSKFLNYGRKQVKETFICLRTLNRICCVADVKIFSMLF